MKRYGRLANKMPTRVHNFIYTISFVLALILFVYALPISRSAYVSIFQGASMRLTQWYAAISMLYLYLTLIISPLYHSLTKLPGKKLAIYARKPLGISACIFAVLHSFFGYTFVGGLRALPYFGSPYRAALIIGLIATAILVLLAITSLNTIHRYLGSRWKKIHRLIYPAGILILFHTFLITTHLEPYELALSIISFVLLSILFILECIRLNDYMEKKFPHVPHHAISLTGSGISVLVLYWAFFILYHAH